MSHRLKGIEPKGTFRYRDAVYVVKALSGYPPRLREGRQKWKILPPGCLKESRKLRTDIPAQRRVCLFVNVSATVSQSPPAQVKDFFIGLLRRKMAGLCVDYQHSGIVGSEIHLRVNRYLRGNASGGELDAGIESAGEVVCNNEKKDHVFALSF